MAVKSAHTAHALTKQAKVSEYAKYVFGVLCAEIHGSPWTTNAVQFSDSLVDEEKLFLEALCKEMGLIT
eukprot:CAMPEP_0172158680 /NCGR_PEP_ID=MMETSP1050-20130122/4515_1 /TAXON_ID=233186 /ORGANISM="Cryptomonas curvata, Strain CCAP979/52" /LENGTH=68 /DNA_ID=CAMNT_0012828115 /DNA_START=334 /DNA_END=540 /DNA_ORIENTATION=-